MSEGARDRRDALRATAARVGQVAKLAVLFGLLSILAGTVALAASLLGLVEMQSIMFLGVASSGLPAGVSLLLGGLVLSLMGRWAAVTADLAEQLEDD